MFYCRYFLSNEFYLASLPILDEKDLNLIANWNNVLNWRPCDIANEDISLEFCSFWDYIQSEAYLRILFMKTYRYNKVCIGFWIC